MTTTDIPQLRTRKPTGKPPWPMILLAGGEKTGKSWAAAAFSASDLIGRTFYVELGEHYADEYGSIPGARYEIVQHDGSYRDLWGQISAATHAPRVDDRPNCIVFDSATILWDMLSKQAQATATARWRRKNPNAPEPDDEIQITMDLWNIAKDKFAGIINLLRQHDGPVILTARLEQVAVVANGKPTTEKTWKVQAEKNLPYEVDAVIQLREPRTFAATGLRSTRFQLEPGKPMPMPGFTVEGFLRKLGLDQQGATSPRTVVVPQSSAAPQHAVAEAVARKAQRERRAQPPEGDPWTESPQDLPDEPRPSTHAQRTKLVILVKQKRGITDRAERLALLEDCFTVVPGLTRRPLRSSTDLSFAEAKRLIDHFEEYPDHIAYAEPVDDGPPVSAPNPRNGDVPVAAGVEAALSTPDAASAAAAVQESDALAADWLAAINGAASHGELESIGRNISATVQGGRLLDADRAILTEAWRARKAQLPPPEPPPQDDTGDGDGWSHRMVRERTGATA